MNESTRKPYITVFTPTYNRAYTLRRLYESLRKQTQYDFEWLIVDDGSTDNTESLVQEFIRENSLFNIRYVKKENEGKHIAINVGAKIAMGKLFFIVDSDDALSTNAIEAIEKTEKEIAGMDGFAGVVGLKGNFEGFPIKSPGEQYSQSELENLMGTYIDATSFLHLMLPSFASNPLQLLFLVMVFLGTYLPELLMHHLRLSHHSY